MELWYPPSAWERIMRIQEVFEKANHRTITWKEASEILGVTDRTVRRWKITAEEKGLESLLDKRVRKPSPKRAPEKATFEVIKLYRDTYREWNVKHFHEQLKKHGIKYSYTWTKTLLQERGLVDRISKRNKHRRKRPRKPMVGMMLHTDGSDHEWIPLLSGQKQSLIPVIDDATGEVYAAELFLEEGTKECMKVFKETVERKGVFCSVYSDRAGHFFHTPKAGGKVDLSNFTQFGRAMYELGIETIPAYSPQARGRCERFYRTWQDRLPKELKLHGIKTMAEANRYIREVFIPWYNQNLAVEPLEKSSAFVPYHGKSLDLVFCIKEQRVVNHDNTVQWDNKTLQIEPSEFRVSFAKCRVIVCEHLNGCLSVIYGPHVIGRYDSNGIALKPTNQNLKQKEKLPLAA